MGTGDPCHRIINPNECMCVRRSSSAVGVDIIGGKRSSYTGSCDYDVFFHQVFERPIVLKLSGVIPGIE